MDGVIAVPAFKNRTPICHFLFIGHPLRHCAFTHMLRHRPPSAVAVPDSVAIERGVGKGAIRI